MIVAIGFDHAGVPLRGRLLAAIEEAGHQVLDLGTDSTEPIDYPDKALEVGRAVVSGQALRGILVEQLAFPIEDGVVQARGVASLPEALGGPDRQ